MVSVMRGRGRQRGSRLGPVGSSFNSPAASISPPFRRKHRRHHTGSLSPSFARLKHRVGVLGCKRFGRVATSIQPPPRITGCLWLSLSPSPTATVAGPSLSRSSWFRALGFEGFGYEGEQRKGGRREGGVGVRESGAGKNNEAPLPFLLLFYFFYA